MDKPYNYSDATAYGTLELLTTFMCRYDIQNPAMKERIKELFVGFCGSDRFLEATGTQFMTQLDHWED